jgi:hypothetical protein
LKADEYVVNDKDRQYRVYRIFDKAFPQTTILEEFKVFFREE